MAAFALLNANGWLYNVLRRSDELRRHVRFLRRSRRLLYERLGLDRYSHPCVFDEQLALYLPEVGGVFVEAGAFDGYLESTTYWLERFRQWRGVLIEPVPELAALARRERPRSRVFQCALVPADFEHDSITLRVGGTMSVVEGARGSPHDDYVHAMHGARLAGTSIFQITVPARTLSAVLDEGGVNHIDLLSLDIEGYEAPALRGLDLNRHRPRFIVIEMLDERRQRVEIEEVLGDDYVHEAKLTTRDHLYRYLDSS